MIKRRKKLIEVALPLAAINKASAREKSIRHGHPSTLHMWWARRPLAACRAVLFAQLVDDPSSDPCYCRGGVVDEEAAGVKRAELFNLIEELVVWENSNNPNVINAARAEIARCIASRKIELDKLKQTTIIFGRDEGKDHPDGPISNQGITAYEVVLMRCKPEVVNYFLTTYAPPVLDPFCGGGSIPLEAQRLGLRAHASDLNPVPVLITKALIEIPPKFAGLPPVHPKAEQRTAWNGAEGLAEDVRYYGQWMRDKAEKRIGHLYPKVKITQEMIDVGRDDLQPYLGQELTVIAWLWARTVKSSNPAYAGVSVPLVTSFWLNKKKGKEVWVEPMLDHDNRSYSFRVRLGTPAPEDKSLTEVGTKLGRGCKFRCILSDTPIPEEHIKAEGMADRMGNRLLAVVCEGTRSRVYLSPTAEMEKAVRVPLPKCDGINAPIAEDKRALWCLLYGLTHFDKLFTPRQLTTLVTFSDLVAEARRQVLVDMAGCDWLPNDDYPLAEGGTGPRAYADAIATYLGESFGKLTVFHNTLTRWRPGEGKSAPAFGRQALPMVWDFPEVNPFAGAGGDWLGVIDGTRKVILGVPAIGEGTVRQRTAIASRTYAGEIISCDPPYYDNIGYADLSDFFYVWLRRSLREQYPNLLSTVLTPKAEELIATPYRHEGSKKKAAAFFEEGLGQTVLRWRELGYADMPTTIFYAFKQAETDIHGTASTGWETFLAGVIEAGFTITGTWPMRTESATRLVGMTTNALASSVVLSCVPRDGDASMATRREFINALKRELPDAMRKLQSGNIAPVDLAQAAIGPGMAVFSRYAKVIESDGERMGVRTALSLINGILDEVLAEQEGEFDADTRWAVAWFEQHGMEAGDFGVAETLSKAKNTSVAGLVEAGLLASRGGKVQLLRREQLPDNWDPTTDNRLAEWEATQYLILALDGQGETGAADLLRKLGGDYGEKARDLAYRLYSICERKSWAGEALAYNSLVVAWPEISKLARTPPSAGGDTGILFE